MYYLDNLIYEKISKYRRYRSDTLLHWREEKLTSLTKTEAIEW